MLTELKKLIMIHERLFFLTQKIKNAGSVHDSTQVSTVAEKDTAAAAQAAVGRPKAANGRQRAAHRLRLAAAAQPRPPICLKIDSLAYNWLIRLLSSTHAQAVNVFIIVPTICIRASGHSGL